MAEKVEPPIVPASRVRKNGALRLPEFKRGTPTTRENTLMRNRRIIYLRARGYSFRRIADELAALGHGKVTADIVQRVLIYHRQKFVRELNDEVQNEFVAQYEGLHKIVSESFDAWEASKRGEAVARTRKRKSPKTVKDGGGKDQTVTVEETEHTDTLRESPGNAKYLETARLALNDIRSLLGLNAMDRSAIEKNKAGVVDVTVRALEKLDEGELNQLENIARKMKAARQDEAGVIEVEPNGEVVTWPADSPAPSSGSTSTA